jgi:hypothetical protein
MDTNQRQNSTVVKRCGLSVKKNENSLPLLDVFFKLKTHFMPQKKLTTWVKPNHLKINPM